MISQSQISCDTPTFYIAAIFVKYCYTTVFGCYNSWANLRCSGCYPLGEKLLWNRSIPLFPSLHALIATRKVHGASMGPTWGRQDPGGPHVGPMNLATMIWDVSLPVSASTNINHTNIHAYFLNFDAYTSIRTNKFFIITKPDHPVSPQPSSSPAPGQSWGESTVACHCFYYHSRVYIAPPPSLYKF